jgi:hypothetical protein
MESRSSSSAAGQLGLAVSHILWKMGWGNLNCEKQAPGHGWNRPRLLASSQRGPSCHPVVNVRAYLATGAAEVASVVTGSLHFADSGAAIAALPLTSPQGAVIMDTP